MIYEIENINKWKALVFDLRNSFAFISFNCIEKEKLENNFCTYFYLQIIVMSV